MSTVAPWRDTNTRPIPDALAERIEMWQHKVPDSESIFPYYHGLPPYSYMCILLGMGGIPVQPSPALALADDSAARREFELIAQKGRDLAEKLPSQYEYFANLR